MSIVDEALTQSNHSLAGKEELWKDWNAGMDELEFWLESQRDGLSTVACMQKCLKEFDARMTELNAIYAHINEDFVSSTIQRLNDIDGELDGHGKSAFHVAH